MDNPEYIFYPLLIIGEFLLIFFIIFVIFFVSFSSRNLTAVTNFRFAVGMDQVIRLRWNRPANAGLGEIITYDVVLNVNGNIINTKVNLPDVPLTMSGLPLMIGLNSVPISASVIATSSTRNGENSTFTGMTPVRSCVNTSGTGSTAYIFTGGPNINTSGYSGLNSGDICCSNGNGMCTTFSSSDVCMLDLPSVGCIPLLNR